MVVMMLSKSPCVFFSIIHGKTSSGARPVLPMGVAPEAIVEKKIISSIGSKTLCLLSYHQIVALLNNIAGCALSAPDGSSPRGYTRIFSGIDSKNEFSSADLFVPFHQFFVDFLDHHQYSDMSHQTFF
jgi:hypothetical protein